MPIERKWFARSRLRDSDRNRAAERLLKRLTFDWPGERTAFGAVWYPMKPSIKPAIGIYDIRRTATGDSNAPRCVPDHEEQRPVRQKRTTK